MVSIGALQNVEDKIFTSTSGELNKILTQLKAIGKLLAPTGNVGIKTVWDARTEVICGRDPADDKFFVATREVFKNPAKAAKSSAAIQKMYNGQVAMDLAICFTYLDTVVTDSVMGGHVLFANDKSGGSVDGKNMITFKPNATQYAAEPDSEIGREISSAALGIVFRQKFTGPSLNQMKQSKFDDTDTNDNGSVFITKDNFKNMSGILRFRPDESNNYMGAILAAEKSMNAASGIIGSLNNATSRIDFSTNLKSFIKGKGNVPAIKLHKDYMIHLMNLYSQGILSSPTLKGQNLNAFKYMEIIDYINKHQREVISLIDFYNNLSKAKTILVGRLNIISNATGFTSTTKGVKVEDPAGFVAVSTTNAIKLVSDLEFDG